LIHRCAAGSEEMTNHYDNNKIFHILKLKR